MLSTPGLYADPVAMPLPAGNASGVVVAGPCRLIGWGLKESTGMGSVSMDIFDGNDATGQLAVPINLTTSESVRDWLGPTGLLMTRGLYVRINSGTPAGALWVEVLPPDYSYSATASQEGA